MTTQFTLGKNERLKSRKDIERLFSNGKNFIVTSFRVYYIVNKQVVIGNWQKILQFGVGVSAKNFKKAPDRNRIKRLIKEAWRMQKNELKEQLINKKKQLHVFFIYTAKDLPDFNLIKDKVGLTLQKLSKLINENNSADS